MLMPITKLSIVLYVALCCVLAVGLAPLAAAENPIGNMSTEKVLSPTPVPTAGAVACGAINNIHNDGGSVAAVTGSQLLSFMLASEHKPEVMCDEAEVDPLYDALYGSDTAPSGCSRYTHGRRELTGSFKLEYLLSQEAVPVTGSEMLAHFLSQEAVPVTGSEMLAHFLSQEAVPVTGSQLLSFMLASEHKPEVMCDEAEVDPLRDLLLPDFVPLGPSDHCTNYVAGRRFDLPAYSLEQILNKDEVTVVTGCELLDFFLNGPTYATPTATPSPPPHARVRTSGAALLNFFSAYSEHDEIWTDASALRGKPLVEFLMRNQDVLISGAELLNLLSEHDSISSVQRERLLHVLGVGDFSVTGQVILDYLTVIEGMAVKGTSIEGGVSLASPAVVAYMDDPLAALYEAWSKNRHLVTHCIMKFPTCPDQLASVVSNALSEAEPSGEVNSVLQEICSLNMAKSYPTCALIAKSPFPENPQSLSRFLFSRITRI